MTSLTITHKISMTATDERLWSALTDPEQTVQYGYRYRFESSGQEGDPFQWVDADGNTVIRGHLARVEPEKLLILTWDLQKFEETKNEPASRVTFMIEPHSEIGGISHLTLTHDRLDDSPNTHKVAEHDWPIILTQLKEYLEQS